MADFIRRGEFDRHLSRMRMTYRRRRDAVVRALATWLPDLPVSGIDASYTRSCIYRRRRSKPPCANGRPRSAYSCNR
ncbi:MAG TPA: hypothetical protein VFM96_09240, partial [Gaiellaceae bacterium]|nr:hypothetical protein [Gaiellaceae bacterium]